MGNDLSSCLKIQGFWGRPEACLNSRQSVHGKGCPYASSPVLGMEDSADFVPKQQSGAENPLIRPFPAPSHISHLPREYEEPLSLHREIKQSLPHEFHNGGHGNNMNIPGRGNLRT